MRGPRTLNEKLEKLLRSKFHVFWSQVIFDQSVSRFVDSYLRFCLRAHDLEGLEARGYNGKLCDPSKIKNPNVQAGWHETTKHARKPAENLDSC